MTGELNTVVCSVGLMITPIPLPVGNDAIAEDKLLMEPAKDDVFASIFDIFVETSDRADVNIELSAFIDEFSKDMFESSFEDNSVTEELMEYTDDPIISSAKVSIVTVSLNECTERDKLLMMALSDVSVDNLVRVISELTALCNDCRLLYIGATSTDEPPPRW